MNFRRHTTCWVQWSGGGTIAEAEDRNRRKAFGPLLTKIGLEKLAKGKAKGKAKADSKA